MSNNKYLTPLQAIRKKCLDCCGGAYGVIRDCPIRTCTLYPYRLGKLPKESMNPEDSEAGRKSILSEKLMGYEGTLPINTVSEGTDTTQTETQKNAIKKPLEHGNAQVADNAIQLRFDEVLLPYNNNLSTGKKTNRTAVE